MNNNSHKILSCALNGERVKDSLQKHFDRKIIGNDKKADFLIIIH